MLYTSLRVSLPRTLVFTKKGVRKGAVLTSKNKLPERVPGHGDTRHHLCERRSPLKPCLYLKLDLCCDQPLRLHAYTETEMITLSASSLSRLKIVPGGLTSSRLSKRAKISRLSSKHFEPQGCGQNISKNSSPSSTTLAPSHCSYRLHHGLRKPDSDLCR